MSKSIISLSRGTSSLGIVRRELDRIERVTGYRPIDWLMSAYDEDIDEFYTPEGFDWESFEMHIDALADSYIEFVQQHYQHLNVDF